MSTEDKYKDMKKKSEVTEDDFKGIEKEFCIAVVRAG